MTPGLYALGRLDWSSGELIVRMVGIDWREETSFASRAYTWQSRQAARQYLRRSDHLSADLRVINLRELGYDPRART